MGLDMFQFDLLRNQPGLLHAIFGRTGGVSRPPFASLNVGADVGDEPESIRQNYRLICEALGLRQEDLVTVRQVHSNRVARVTANDRGRIVGQLDGMVTDAPHLPLMLRFADCVPIIIYDPKRAVLGVAHAGWRGTVHRIAEQLVRTMREGYGCHPADLLAGIGPSIGACCYPVGPEVIRAALDAFGAGARDSQGHALLVSRDGMIQLDLWAANRLLLERAGVEQIETAGLCTCCHRERFFSHRGDGGRTGRFPMVAMLR